MSVVTRVVQTKKLRNCINVKHVMFVSLFGITSSVLFAQESSGQVESFNRNKVSLVISHTHVPGGVDNSGKKSWLVLPSWGLDYDFSFSEQWGIGLHSDLVIQDFEYEEGEGIIKKRTKPFATAIVGTYHVTDHLTLIAGGGMELAPEGTLGLIRTGVDCGWELPGNWELSASLMADIKINAYNAWVLGLGIGKTF